MTVNDAVLEWQSTHDDRAFEQVFNHFQPGIKGLTRKFPFLGDNGMEDLTGDLNFALFKSATKYRSERGPFPSYFYGAAKSTVARTLEIFNRDNFISFAHMNETEDGRPIVFKCLAVNDEIEKQVTIQDAVKKVLSQYSALQTRIFILYLDGYRFVEIQRFIDNAFQNADDILLAIHELKYYTKYKHITHLIKMIRDDIRRLMER